VTRGKKRQGYQFWMGKSGDEETVIGEPAGKSQILPICSEAGGHLEQTSTSQLTSINLVKPSPATGIASASSKTLMFDAFVFATAFTWPQFAFGRPALLLDSITVPSSICPTKKDKMTHTQARRISQYRDP